MKSKSELKREATSLQRLGEELVHLNPKQLAELNLPEKLVDAISQLKIINARTGKRRLTQYVGKLMRDVDPTPIQAYLENLKGISSAQKTEFQLLEKWRERLLTEDKTALTEYIELHQPVDIQKLRQLITAAKRSDSPTKAKIAQRELFRYLKSNQ